MARALDGAIADLAPKTFGLLTNDQLDFLGVSRQQRRTLIARGALVVVAPGVVRLAAYPRSWHQSLLAAVLAAGDGAVASHASAAALWGFDGIGPGAIEVAVPPQRRPRRVPGRVHRMTLSLADVDRRHLIARTSPTRTLIDLAARLEPAALEAVLDGAERDGTIWRPRLRWRVEQLRVDGRPGRPGLASLEALLDRTEGRPLGETWLEQEAIRVIADAGLPAPRAQVRRRKHGGGVARVDLWWDHARLVVEVAGHGSHATRRRRQSDAERAARLGLMGWAVVEFTYEDVVERPDHVVDIIRSYLSARQ